MAPLLWSVHPQYCYLRVRASESVRTDHIVYDVSRCPNPGGLVVVRPSLAPEILVSFHILILFRCYYLSCEKFNCICYDVIKCPFLGDSVPPGHSLPRVVVS